MVSDPAALAEDLSAKTLKLDLGAVVDTLAKTSWGDQSISANTLGSQRAELWGLPREIVATLTGRLGHPGISVCSPRAPDQLGSVCNVGFSPSPAVGITDTPDTRDLTATLGASRSLHHCSCRIPRRQTHTIPETCKMPPPSRNTSS